MGVSGCLLVFFVKKNGLCVKRVLIRESNEAEVWKLVAEITKRDGFDINGHFADIKNRCETFCPKKLIEAILPVCNEEIWEFKKLIGLHYKKQF